MNEYGLKYFIQSVITSTNDQYKIINDNILHSFCIKLSKSGVSFLYLNSYAKFLSAVLICSIFRCKKMYNSKMHIHIHIIAKVLRSSPITKSSINF